MANRRLRPCGTLESTHAPHMFAALQWSCGLNLTIQKSLRQRSYRYWAPPPAWRPPVLCRFERPRAILAQSFGPWCPAVDQFDGRRTRPDLEMWCQKLCKFTELRPVKAGKHFTPSSFWRFHANPFFQTGWLLLKHSSTEGQKWPAGRERLFVWCTVDIFHDDDAGPIECCVSGSSPIKRFEIAF